MAVINTINVGETWTRVMESSRLNVPLSLCIFNVFTALAIHQVVKRYEPRASTQMITLVFLPPLILLGTEITHLSVHSFTRHFFMSLTIYITTLLGSMLIYRLSPWHPLSRFPGPFVLRTSKLGIAWYTRHGTQHTYLKSLHDKYGDYVRIGPNEISIRHVDAVIPVLGSTGLPKGPLWDGRNVIISNAENRNLIGLRAWNSHADRRKLWNKGFSSAPLKDYEQIIIRRGKQLIDALDARRDRVDISTWIGYFTFDFMGDMAFGGGFELMRDGGDKEGVWTMIKGNLRKQYLNGHVPWIPTLLQTFAPLDNEVVRMRSFAATWAKKRMVEGSFSADLWHHFYEADNSISKHPFARVTSEATLAILAGSDTTRTALANVVYFMCLHPEYMTRLQTEVNNTFPELEEPFDASRLAHMPFVNAVINEAMRLQPSLPSGAQRSVLRGTGGKMIGSRFVPEDTQVFVHPYSLHRDPRYFFPHPESFWPDRWLPESDRQFPTQLFGPKSSPSAINASLVLDHTAYLPFSFGPANCVGKNLAIVEMRMIVSLIAQKFDIRFAKGYETGRWVREQKDWLIMEVGELDVTLTPRF